MYCIFITFDYNCNCKLIVEAGREKEIILQDPLVVQILFTMFFINLETNSSKTNSEYFS